MGKYEVLAKYLSNLKDRNEITLKFEEIEGILGFQLPYSARIHRPWWANDKTHTHATDGWLRVGWSANFVNLNEGVVTFKKVGGEITSFKIGCAAQYNHRNFEEFARNVLSKFFGEELAPRRKMDWPKLFDLVSPDYNIVGDAKFLSMVKGRKIPPAKFATIAEHVWLLEKINAKIRFIVFGNDPRVPNEWLKRYGNLIKDVNFYFINEKGEILRLK